MYCSQELHVLNVSFRKERQKWENTFTKVFKIVIFVLRWETIDQCLPTYKFGQEKYTFTLM